MTRQTLIRSLLTWSFILVLAVANGAFREGLLVPRLDLENGPALVVSGVLLAFLILATACLFLPWLGARKSADLLLIGLIWLSLTLMFEFAFGLLRGESLDEMLAAYTFEGGNLWPAVLAMTAVAPWLAARLRARLRAQS